MRFLTTHTTAFLYAGFWLSLANYGLWAPPERVALLESGLVTEGWHLSLMAVCFGAPVLALYVWRMRTGPAQETNS
jgi:hypothetical protein